MQSLTEKYRPKSYDQVIGQSQIINALKNERPDSRPHKLFLGASGTGKTTVAKIYAKEIGFYLEEMNASDERKLEHVRGKIKSFASFKTNRIIFLDEGDALTPDAQNALRGIMEKTRSTIFIISGNHPHKIIKPIKSRCATYNFNRISDDLILRQIINICKKEGISLPQTKGHEKDCGCDNCKTRLGFLELIKQSDGDMRKAINTLETIVGEGNKITQKSVLAYQKPNIAVNVLKLAYNGNFRESLDKLESEFISSHLDPKIVVGDMFRAIKEVVPVDDHRSMLYRELARTEVACRQENNPLIQFTGFIAYAWWIPHVNIGCPVLKGD